MTGPNAIILIFVPEIHVIQVKNAMDIIIVMCPMEILAAVRETSAQAVNTVIHQTTLVLLYPSVK